MLPLLLFEREIIPLGEINPAELTTDVERNVDGNGIKNLHQWSFSAQHGWAVIPNQGAAEH